MTDTTKLAEKAAKFLGLKIGKNPYYEKAQAFHFGICQENYLLSESDIFDDSLPFAPILAHLAKREMEKLEFVYKHDWDGMNHEWLFMKPETNQIDEWDWSKNIYEGYHPEDYKALWLAIEKTGVMG